MKSKIKFQVYSVNFNHMVLLFPSLYYQLVSDLRNCKKVKKVMHHGIV